MSEREHLDQDLAAFVGAAEPISAELRARHEHHLESCPACRVAVAEAEQVLRALETAPLLPSADFDARLFARLDAVDAAVRTEAKREFWRALWNPARWVLVASPVAAGIAGFVLSRNRTEEDKPMPEGTMSALGALDDLELGADLDLYRDLDAAEYLDVADDLDLLLNEEEAG